MAGAEASPDAAETGEGSSSQGGAGGLSNTEAESSSSAQSAAQIPATNNHQTGSGTNMHKNTSIGTALSGSGRSRVEQVIAMIG
jgi:hypothetical protein